MALFQIKHRISGSVLFELECGSLKIAVEAAVKQRAYLGGADLGGADLGGAYLSGADLGGAYLGGVYLGGAYLSGADLSGAYLGGAYLSGADLRGADLSGAYLGGADMGGAYLGGADLGGADLRGADLGGADLRGYKINGDIGLIDAGSPNGFYAYGLVDAETGELQVIVGCQRKSLADGRAYWSSPTHHDPQNRREVLAALDYIEAVARLRGWVEAKGENDG